MAAKHDNLNPMRREAVTHGEGSLLVIAGPGSGKTFVLTQRIRFLTEERGVASQSVLALTSSRATAREMEKRYWKLCDRERTGALFGTSHAFLFHTLRTAHGYQADQAIGKEEQRVPVSTVLWQKKTESGDFHGLMQNVLSEIALVKKERAEFSHYYPVSCPAGQFREVYRTYERGLAELRKIDCEDTLRMCCEFLEGRANIRRTLSECYAWILVDEFQDINCLQYEVVHMLTKKRGNLMIAGDDDQLIYRFRGAAPETVLHFERDYPKASRVVLNVGCRSTPGIVKTAGRLIQRNKIRFPKEVTAVRPSGKPVSTIVCPTPHAEADYLIREARELARDGARYDSIVILYRTNLQSRLLAWRLHQKNIPFRTRGILPDLNEHRIAWDLLAYLRLVRDRAEPSDLLRTMDRSNRYICREAVRMGGEGLAGLRRRYEKSGKHWMDERFGKLAGEFRRLEHICPSEAIVYICTGTGCDNFLKQHVEEREIETEELSDILKEIEASAGDFPTVSAWQADGTTFSATYEVQSKRAEAGNKVRLITYHTSKELGFPTVFLFDMNEGIVLYRKANGRKELEEEQRIFYAAITRARDKLQTLICKTRFHREAEGNRFVREYESH